MPFKDGTGPQCKGPMTGKGKGSCIKAVTKDEIAQIKQKCQDKTCLNENTALQFK